MARMVRPPQDRGPRHAGRVSGRDRRRPPGRPSRSPGDCRRTGSKAPAAHRHRMIDPEASDMSNDEALPLELLEDGDLAFVDAIREVHDADALAEFASTWFKDRRPDSRWLLYEYLDRPLNAFRHEGLIKRLFKRAEAEGDDPLMARFLVLFDRSIRREREIRYREGQLMVVANTKEIVEIEAKLREQGYHLTHLESPQADCYRISTLQE